MFTHFQTIFFHIFLVAFAVMLPNSVYVIRHITNIHQYLLGQIYCSQIKVCHVMVEQW